MTVDGHINFFCYANSRDFAKKSYENWNKISLVCIFPQGSLRPSGLASAAARLSRLGTHAPMSALLLQMATARDSGQVGPGRNFNANIASPTFPRGEAGASGPHPIQSPTPRNYTGRDTAAAPYVYGESVNASSRQREGVHGHVTFRTTSASPRPSYNYRTGSSTAHSYVSPSASGSGVYEAPRGGPGPGAVGGSLAGYSWR